MNTSRDMESVNDIEVVSSKTNPVEVLDKRTCAEATKAQQSNNHSDSFLKLIPTNNIDSMFEVQIY